MSNARYTRYMRKRRKPSLQWIIEIGLFVMIATVLFFTIAQVAKTNLLDILIHALQTDTRFLFILITNIFIIGGIVMVVIFQWADQERARFHENQQKYRSMLVSKDYYQSINRIKVEQFMVDMPEEGDRKIQVDHDLKKSSLVTVDYRRITDEGRKTVLSYDGDGRLSGNFKTYFANGNILAEVSYKHGLLDGTCNVYYPNGCLHNQKYFRQGKLHGIFKAWDEDGSLFFEIEYRDDVQHGVDKSFRKNGVLEFEDLYENGQLVQRKTYDETGSFKYVQKYDEEEDS